MCEGAKEQIGLLFFTVLEQKEAMIDPADEPAACEIGRPARAFATAVALKPLPDPSLRSLTRGGITN